MQPIKSEILPFVAIWVDLEDIMLSEISQTERDKYRMILLICEIFKNPKQMSKQSRNILIDTENKLKFASREGSRKRAKKVKGIERYRLPVIK